MIPKIEFTKKAICPECNDGEFIIDHKAGRYGPWGCRSCGACFMLDIGVDTVEMTPHPTNHQPAWLIVKTAGSNPPVYFVIDHMIYGEKDDDNDRYYVEESTCPTNLIPVSAIITEGDTDPHGILEFVAHIPKSHWKEEYPDGGWIAAIDKAIIT